MRKYGLKKEVERKGNRWKIERKDGLKREGERKRSG